MKTILCIALFMMTTITFAQESKNTRTNSQSKSIPNNQQTDLKDNKDKTARTGFVKLGDIKGESKPNKSTARRRVVVLKSNKQGNPNKK